MNGILTITLVKAMPSAFSKEKVSIFSQYCGQYCNNTVVNNGSDWHVTTHELNKNLRRIPSSLRLT